MPVWARGSKVTKPAATSMYSNGARGNAGRASSLSGVAQEQLQQFAQHAAASNAVTDVHGLGNPGGQHAMVSHVPADFHIPAGVVHGLNGLVAPPGGEDYSGGDEEEEEDNNNNNNNMHARLQALSNTDGITEGLQSLQHALAGADGTGFSMAMDDPMDSFMTDLDSARLTAADVALDMYGDSIKIDSSLCRKLASETALRDPIQRRSEQRLNLERRSNVEAMLAHITGRQVERSCKNCHKGHGPWKECVVYEGQMCGSCTNCWFNASGARCTFHENNHPPPQAQYGPSASGDTPSAVKAYQQTPVPLPLMLQPTLSRSQPTPSMSQLTSSMSQPASSASQPASSIPQTTTTSTTTSFEHLSPASASFSSLRSELQNWGSTEPTRRLIASALNDVINVPPGERHHIRIEAAAKELGMRIAEYEEFLRTPEGMADQQLRAEDRALPHRSFKGLRETCLPRSSSLS
ncbi:hypothetical protein AK830_g9748 [Neonectria ditissima]|uniref:Uncharacterized protein n=1 Tax=Neonectria ditissima TaxID=78410 RepID=A0A0N8H5Q4_9HYPO|nr:hypothetical protein AK830_g9748 [Neonectria ditissima]